MEVLVAGLVVLAVAYLVIHEIASDAPAVPDLSVPVTATAPELPVATLTDTVSAVTLPSAAGSDPPPAPASAPGSVAVAEPVAEPSSKPFRSPEPRVHAIPHFTPVPPAPPRPPRPPREPQTGPVRSTSVLGSLGPTEPDRRTHPMRRTASALALTAITLAIAGGVGGAIYLGLRQLG